MKLPNRQAARVPREKIVDYLLSDAHPRGRNKEAFFRRFGYAAERWEELAYALRQHAIVHDVATAEVSPFGMRYNIVGKIVAIDGRTPNVMSVWFIDIGETIPRLISAYPGPKRKDDK